MTKLGIRIRLFIIKKKERSAVSSSRLRFLLARAHTILRILLPWRASYKYNLHEVSSINHMKPVHRRWPCLKRTWHGK